MLEIKPIQTKEEQKEICELCGVDFDPACFAYGVREDEKLFGIAQFRIINDYAVIYDLSNAINVEDLDALIITGKAALNFIDLCGIKEVVAHIKNRDLIKMLGFKKDGEEIYRLNLEGYFESPCQKQI